MNNFASPRRGRSAVAILLLSTLFIVTLALAFSSASANSPPAANDEPRAVLVGLRADRVASGFSLQPASFAPNLLAGEARALFRQKGVYHDPVLDAPIALEHVYRLELAPGAELVNVIARLSKRPDVAFVEPDYVAHQVLGPNDEHYDNQWGLAKINAEAAWGVQTGAAKIAVIDAGIDLDHPDLVDRLWTNTADSSENGQDEDSNNLVDDIHGWNFVDDNNDLNSSTGHGTQVAGIIGATGNNGEGIAGVCWNCELIILKVIQPGGTANYSDIAQAIYYAADKNADVINLSLGGYTDSAALRTAVNYAKDSVLVAGVGNDDTDLPFYPAAYDNVLAVAGTDANDVRVHNSNYGAWVDLSAPGEDIFTTHDGKAYGEADGTSLAAPFVSGVAALLKSEHGWTAPQIRAHLLQTAEPIDDDNPGYEGQLGAGRLHAGDALTTPAEPDLVVQAITVDGKSGGQPEPGATVDLQVALTNNWAPVGQLQGTLTSNDSYASIAQNSASFEAMDTYSTAQNSTPFKISVANNAPYGHELDLRLRLRQGGTTIQTIPVRLTVAQQTINVSGIISSDTTWSGDRVYRLTGNVRVQEGATLTAEPGARVEADNDRILEVEGKLVATGTEAAPIIFTSAVSETASSWRGLNVGNTGQLQLAHCEVAYAGTGVNFESPSQTYTIDDCYIHHNSTGIQTGWGYNVNVVINRTRLVHNGAGVIGNSNFIIQDSEVAYNYYTGISGGRQILRNNIHHTAALFDPDMAMDGGVGIRLSSSGYSDTMVYSNTIVMNSVGIALEWGADYNFHANNVDGNDVYNAYLYGENDVNLDGNWWGTTDLNAIHDSIYDWGENSDRGIATVEPILTTPSSAAPAYLYDISVSPDTTIGLEEVTLDLNFSGAMDEGLTPKVVLQLEDVIASGTDGGAGPMASAPDGAMWWATSDGLIRYNGSDLNTYQNLPFDYVAELVVDIEGDVWVVTNTWDEGVFRFDGSNWTTYLYEATGGPLPAASAADIAASPTGGIWLAQHSHVTHFDGQTATTFTLEEVGSSSIIIDVEVGDDGSLWAQDGGRLYSLNGSTWVTHDPLATNGGSGRIMAMKVVDADEVWLLTTLGLREYDGNEWSSHLPGITFDGTLHAAIEVTADGVVLASHGSQLLQYDGSQMIQRFSLPESVYSIGDIVETANKSAWFATNIGAVQIYETPIGTGYWLDHTTYRATHNVTAAMPRGPYDVSVGNAIAADGRETPPMTHFAFNLDYAGEVADSTPPPAPSLSVLGIDGDASGFSAKWSGDDPDSPIKAYRYAIGSSPGARDIVNWTTTTATSVERSGFGFVEGETYWFSLQAQNSGGLWSASAIGSFVSGQGAYETHIPAIWRQ